MRLLAQPDSPNRSIVKQRIGPPKTEASQKPIPLNTELAKALRLWKMKTIYNRSS
jgi:integrase